MHIYKVSGDNLRGMGEEGVSAILVPIPCAATFRYFFSCSTSSLFAKFMFILYATSKLSALSSTQKTRK